MIHMGWRDYGALLGAGWLLTAARDNAQRNTPGIGALCSPRRCTAVHCPWRPSDATSLESISPCSESVIVEGVRGPRADHFCGLPRPYDMSLGLGAPQCGRRAEFTASLPGSGLPSALSRSPRASCFCGHWAACRLARSLGVHVWCPRAAQSLA